MKDDEIVFSVSCAATKDMIEQSDGKAFDYQKERWASELGMKIAEKKGWSEYDEGDIVKAELRLYVFTPAELKTYRKAIQERSK